MPPMVAVAPFMLRDEDTIACFRDDAVVLDVSTTNSLKDSLAFAVEDK